MKIMLIILGVLLALFIASQIYVKVTNKDIESYPYTVVKEYDGFETRNYEASLFTTVKVGSSEYDKASREGFSALAGYIFGGNDKNEQIAMTSPVVMSLEDNMTMMFMVPKDFNKGNLPTPNQSNIKFKEEPPKKVAAITFGGWASDERIKEHKNELTTALDAQGIEYTSNFFFLGYNSPWDLINRRNEVMVELK